MGFLDIPQIVVLNKCDAVSEETRASLMRTTNGVAVSAVQRTGFAELLDAIDNAVFPAGYTVLPLVQEAVEEGA
jgi:GTP-binding protein HflX